MEPLLHLAATVLVAYSLGALAPILSRLLPARIRPWIGWILFPPIFATPLLIPAEWIKLRALAMFIVNEVGLKVIDSFRRDRPLTLREYLWFLIPFPSLAVVY